MTETETHVPPDLAVTLAEERDIWMADFAILSEELSREARERGWCTDYERVIESVNGKMRRGHIDGRRTKFRFKTTVEYEVETPYDSDSIIENIVGSLRYVHVSEGTNVQVVSSEATGPRIETRARQAVRARRIQRERDQAVLAMAEAMDQREAARAAAELRPQPGDIITREAARSLAGYLTREDFDREVMQDLPVVAMPAVAITTTPDGARVSWAITDEMPTFNIDRE